MNLAFLLPIDYRMEKGKKENVTITLNLHQAAICHLLSFAGSLVIHELSTQKVLYLSLQPQNCHFSFKYASPLSSLKHTFGVQGSVHLTLLYKKLHNIIW